MGGLSHGIILITRRSHLCLGLSLSLLVLGVSPTQQESKNNSISFGTGCDCGRGERGADSQQDGATTAAPVRFVNVPMSLIKKKSRIVNGYEPKRRPWMALLELHKSVPKEGEIQRNNPQCGGALLNKYYVITAAHCFCSTPLKCKTKPTRPDFDMKQVTVYLGLHDIGQRRANPLNAFAVSHIVIYPLYIRDERDQNDVAVVRLSRMVTFSGVVAPVCLPTQASFKDTDVPEVFVAGWGLLSDMNCTTDSGPSPYKRCAFPFTWGGSEYRGCTFSSTPSAEDAVCAQLRKQAGEDVTKAPVKIVDESGKALTTCFDTSPKNYGWCGTCKSKTDQSGFCGTSEMSSAGTASESPAGSASRSATGSHMEWGWCNKFCLSERPGDWRTTTLQEAQLSTLTPHQCAVYGATMKAVPSIELCAGLKERPGDLKTYRATGQGQFTLVEKNRENGTDEFFLGGRDSCKGDSGGPLYLWHDSKAVLIGVVSRGKGCAGFNQAGIYTRITAKLNWIQQQIKSGNC